MSLEGLSLVESPCIIQEYWDHSGTFYKVYVMDSDVMVYRRPSLPDIQQLSQRQPLRSLIFDSRYAYPTLDDFVIPNENELPAFSVKDDHPAAYPLHHSPIDLNDISPFPGDHLSLGALSDSEGGYPLSSYSSTTSSCADMEFNYPFDEFAVSEQQQQLPVAHSGGSVHHTPHRGLKPGASPCHKFARQSHSQDSQHLVGGHRSDTSPTPPSAATETSDQITQQVTCHRGTIPLSVSPSLPVPLYLSVSLSPLLTLCPSERFKEIASHLQKGFGLTLFGFDVLIPNQSSASNGDRDEFLIIDVNFFPSYKEVHDFPSRLRKMLRNKSSSSSTGPRPVSCSSIPSSPL
jgi:hypothetical protein